MLVSQMLSLSEELSEMKMIEKFPARVMFKFWNLAHARYIHAVVSHLLSSVLSYHLFKDNTLVKPFFLTCLQGKEARLVSTVN